LLSSLAKNYCKYLVLSKSFRVFLNKFSSSPHLFKSYCTFITGILQGTGKKYVFYLDNGFRCSWWLCWSQLVANFDNPLQNVSD